MKRRLTMCIDYDDRQLKGSKIEEAICDILDGFGGLILNADSCDDGLEDDDLDANPKKD